ncbi:transposase [Kitasatospora sp. NBC_00240]|uniref:transposase n=1 Tax=Kitasatospora sp. NBC_00240 TaxID=2903567 RepID=UPI00224EC61D|nr:transposase [Kitasatospora sp. NBC_00240]MCX5215480.1 transposase [Kitasatospora sp. NBC_00240]
MQRLLGETDWDADGVRDDVRDFVVETIGAKDGILIGDDTSFLKKGSRSAGVQRQYTGTAGRTENSQVGTFLAYASSKGRALVDRELSCRHRRRTTESRAAGVPDEGRSRRRTRTSDGYCSVRSMSGFRSRG